MKYLIQTLSYEDKCKMQEQCNRRPKAEGLTFKGTKMYLSKKLFKKLETNFKIKQGEKVLIGIR